MHTKSSPIRALLSGASVAVIGDLLARALSLILTILVTRRLGPTLYGEYTSILASLALVSSVIGFGLDTWLLREGGRYPTRLLDFSASVLLTKLGAACCVVLYFTLISNRGQLELAFIVGCLGVLADTALNTGFAALRVHRRNTAVALAQLTLPGLLLIVLLLLQSTSLMPLTLIAIQTSISWLIALLLFVRGLHLLEGRRPKINLRLVAVGAWAFVVADLFANVYGQSATLQLRANADALSVGLFRAALNTLNVSYIPPAIIFGVSLPILSSLLNSKREYVQILRLWVAGALVYGVLASMMLGIGAPWIIKLVYGPNFTDSAPILQLLSASTLFKTGSFACALVMLSRGQQTLRIVFQCIVMIANLLMGFYLIPAMGMTGAAWVTLGTEIFLFMLYASGAIWVLSKWKA